MLNYKTYIKESKNLQKFEKGDTVWYLSMFAMMSDFDGKNEITGTLIDNEGETWYQLKKYKGKSIQWINGSEIYRTEEEFNEAKMKKDEKRQRIKDEMKRKAEAKQKFIDSMKQFDPYGEEQWDDMSEKKVLYQKELCQDIWDGDVIKEKIRKKLIRIAKDFYNDVDLETEIIDIHLTGSMANYNYTASSDIDVHIITNFTDVNEDTVLVKKAIDGMRFIWNLRHNIIIKGHDVELYIQDDSEEHKSSGLYSLLKDEWVIKPVYNPPDVDTEDIDVKYEARVYDIERFEKLSKMDLDPEKSEEYYNSAKDLKSKIMKARKEGLSTGGEFSIENLVFKKLRNEGGLKKLIDLITRFYDKIYSQ